jgi:hypothetical protein
LNESHLIASKSELLARVAQLLTGPLVADAWGRLLVEVVRMPDGRPVVAGIAVEEVIDEVRVDAAFGGEAARAAGPALAAAVDALCSLDGVDLENVRGGTFVRRSEGDFGWLPALVHAPSTRLDRERDELVAGLERKVARLAERFGIPDRGKLALDLRRETMIFSRAEGGEVRARATLLGTFASASRTWGWGSYSPHLPEDMRRGCALVIDSIMDRDMWELSTPAFATDVATAWALCAFVCDRLHGDGVLAVSEDGGRLFVLLREVHGTMSVL